MEYKRALTKRNRLNQDLKIHEVDGFNNETKAKGVKKIKTFNITYLRAYEIAKFNNPTDIILFDKPEMVNKFIEESPM